MRGWAEFFSHFTFRRDAMPVRNAQDFAEELQKLISQALAAGLSDEDVAAELEEAADKLLENGRDADNPT
jgi:hypothetical protein